MSSASDPSERATAWRAALAPWLTPLVERLSFVVQPMPDQDALARHFWIHLAVPDANALVTTGDVEDREWTEWFEAFELIDLLAHLDSTTCWALLLGSAADALRGQGCPTSFFNGVQPRYELRFAHVFAPSPRIEELLHGKTPLTPSSPAFTQTKARLVEALRAKYGDDHCDRLLRPVQLRLRFMLPPFYNATVRCLTRVLTLSRARPLSLRAGRRVHVRAFGFDMSRLVLPDGMRTLLRQIASHAPIFELTLGAEDPYARRNLIGPVLWTLLPSSPPLCLGVRKLTISAFTAHDEAIAVCAAIGQSHSLRTLTLLRDRANKWVYPDSTLATSLALALFHRSATHAIHTVDLRLNRHSIEAMTTVLTSTNPIAYMAALYDGLGTVGQFHEQSFGKVRIRAHAELFHRLDGCINSLHLGAQNVECCVVDPDYGDRVRVLAPGVGLCLVRRTDIVSETPLASETTTHTVRSLTLRLENEWHPEAVVRLLRVIGAPLTELTIEYHVNSWSRALDVNALLRACPRLRRLELAHVELGPLTLLPTGCGQNLESLTLRSCSFDRQFDSSDTLGAITAETFPRLASLAVSGDSTIPRAFQEQLTNLALARDVQRLVVTCDNKEVRKQYRSLWRSMRDGDNIKAMPLRNKLALLSVASAGASRNAPYALNVDTVTLIFAMVAPPMRQRLCVFVG